MVGASRFVMLLATPFSSLLYRPTSLMFLRPVTRRLSTTTPPSRFTLSYPRTITSSHQQLHSQSLSWLSEQSAPNSPCRVSKHPWPEWSHFIDVLLSQSPPTRDHGLLPEDAFVVCEEKELSDEFSRNASACLAFARARPELLGSLSRRDIEVIVSNGTPFLFKSALDTARRMRAYLGLDGSNVLEFDNANTVDIMKYILSYTSNPSVPGACNSLYSREVADSSVRNLLCQMAEVSLRNLASNQPASEQCQVLGEFDQYSKPVKQNVQMKRGDWICPKCSFMNFARNVKCLECEEPRPKRQLTGREWECPQCNFFNFGRNLLCLRCDCKRPHEVAASNGNSVSELGKSKNYAYNTHMKSRLIENEEKAQRWFNKVSQLNNTSDLSSLAADEDFPEIMPLRKGENRFVVSTRKTPLERRLANSQNDVQMGDYGAFVGNTSQSGDGSSIFDFSSWQGLDHVLGCSSPTSGIDDRGKASEKITQMDTSGFLHQPASSDDGQHPKNDSHGVPIEPLPADAFSGQDQNLKTVVQKKEVEESLHSVSSASTPQTDSLTLSSNFGKSKQSLDFSRKPNNETDNERGREEEAEKSKRWFQRVAELHNVKDLPSAISDEDFPEIMPMRKGENRFVVSKKKDRSLTSPAYKRQLAMEQERKSDFVPFVPFPPGYFARKDTQVPGQVNTFIKHSDEKPSSPKMADSHHEKQGNAGIGVATGNQVRSSGDQHPKFGGDNLAPICGNSNQSSLSTQSSEIQSSAPLREQNTSESMNFTDGSQEMHESQNIRSGWTGKSLEGSAVKEPDPLDMSEEAKAERWFQRVAQIKDISELSQIPDEDFPSIMPMRKGVNRFVVSKRKTPLERRLTSQHRRNLPTVSSDIVKKEESNS